MVFSIRLTEKSVAATEITLFAKKEKDAARKVPEKAEFPLVLTLAFSYLCLGAGQTVPASLDRSDPSPGQTG